LVLAISLKKRASSRSRNTWQTRYIREASYSRSLWWALKKMRKIRSLEESRTSDESGIRLEQAL